MSTPEYNMEQFTAPQKPKRYYGTSALILLLFNIIYLIPHLDHYFMGGMQGMILLFVLLAMMLVGDLICLFILAAVLRRLMGSRISRFVRPAVIAFLAVFLCVNLYRATRPLPYLQYMIDNIPEAVAHFEENRTEYEAAAEESGYYGGYFREGMPSGPMINMQYVYVENPEDYPQKTGQLSRTSYIHPIDQHWYLLLYQMGAA